MRSLLNCAMNCVIYVNFVMFIIKIQNKGYSYFIRNYRSLSKASHFMISAILPAWFELKWSKWKCLNRERPVYSSIMVVTWIWFLRK